MPFFARFHSNISMFYNLTKTTFTRFYSQSRLSSSLLSFVQRKNKRTLIRQFFFSSFSKWFRLNFVKRRKRKTESSRLSIDSLFSGETFSFLFFSFLNLSSTEKKHREKKPAPKSFDFDKDYRFFFSSFSSNESIRLRFIQFDHDDLFRFSREKSRRFFLKFVKSEKNIRIMLKNDFELTRQITFAFVGICWQRFQRWIW